MRKEAVNFPDRDVPPLQVFEHVSIETKKKKNLSFLYSAELTYKSLTSSADFHSNCRKSVS